jgi:hypothetical protein
LPQGKWETNSRPYPRATFKQTFRVSNDSREVGFSQIYWRGATKMLPLMGKRVTGLAGVILALSIGNAYAFGNACKNVNFSVDNENDYPVTVTRFELYSASEGRWLSDDFKNIVIPGGAKDFAVRRGENVEHAENDRITEIRVHYRYEYTDDSDNALVLSRTAAPTSTSATVDPICVADRWYKGIIHRKPHAQCLEWTSSRPPPATWGCTETSETTTSTSSKP